MGVHDQLAAVARRRPAGGVPLMTRCAQLLGVAVLTMSALLITPLPAASADPCPDVEAVFARGSGEPPGVGGVGQSFIDALRSQIGNRSMNVHPVDYPAST